ncbi:nicotinamidase-related amidase [Rhodococcus sp. 27YEA15]|uniref:cysteine hydrolase family protein n=1 Tax=Rhodococcus sp. 27YEA15 TaxID=3156259 RepID=UPI003C7D9C58
MTSIPTSSIDPARTALLVMDLQNGIVASLPEPETLIATIERTLDKARSRGVTVAYVRVAFTPEDHLAVPSINKTFSGVAAAGMMADDDPTTAIHPRLTPKDGDIIVRKKRFGAFSTTDLDEQLRARGIETLVLTGISTGGVVLNTVLDAADRDYQVLVLTDGVADPDSELHRVLIEKAFPHRAHLVDSSQFESLFAR